MKCRSNVKCYLFILLPKTAPNVCLCQAVVSVTFISRPLLGLNDPFHLFSHHIFWPVRPMKRKEKSICWFAELIEVSVLTYLEISANKEPTYFGRRFLVEPRKANVIEVIAAGNFFGKSQQREVLGWSDLIGRPGHLSVNAFSNRGIQLSA